jgi:hypothetical protein
MRLLRQILAGAIILFTAQAVAGSSYGAGLHLPGPKSRTALLATVPLESFTDRVPDAFERAPVILVANESERQEHDIDIFALMSGRCSTVEIAGHYFACRSVAYFHSKQGRSNFTIVVDDPSDESHVIAFSGENGRRGQGDLYELPIDRMLLNSKHRPKVDGLPVPMVEMSAGICKQLGNFAARQVSSISCSAMDKGGKKYELRFESDGAPITLRRVKPSAPTIQQN